MKRIIDLIKTDFFIIFFLLIVAVIPRLILLDKIPPGIHGDEGWIGINALRIINDGYAPPVFVGDLQGTPTGNLYLVAFILKIFGNSIHSLRLSMALLGIIAIPLFYVFLRYFFDKKISFLTAFAMSFSLIHIYYSRVTFMVISAQFFQILSLIFFIQFDKNRKLYSLILCAICTGLGLYSYYVFILFPFTLIVYLLTKILITKFSFKEIKYLLIFLLFFILFSIPFERIIFFQSKFYFDHFKSYSTIKELLTKNSTITFIGLQAFFYHGINKIKIFFIGKNVDYIDGFGKYYVFNYSYLIFALFGLVISFIKKYRQRFFVFCSFLFFLLAPNFLTFNGIYRRQVLNFINIFFFLAIFIDFVLNKITKKKLVRQFLFLLIIILVIYNSCFNLFVYFKKIPNDQETNWVFTQDLTQTFLKLKKIECYSIRPAGIVIMNR